MHSHFVSKNIYTLLPALVFFLSSCKTNHETHLEVMKVLHDYPSGSGLAYYDGAVYVMGDDASYLMKTDTSFSVTDSIKLFISSEKRIPKDVKADLESITVIKKKNVSSFLLAGSGSLEPYRNACWLINPVTHEKKHYLLDTFYNRIRKEGIPDLNIEGATVLPAGILLASRGNKSFPKNYLILTSYNFWEKQSTATIRLMKTGVNRDTSFFTGISGLDYSYASDQLLLTASTENTANSYDDGSIGKSYLWIINDISSKKRMVALNPDRIIDLEELDPRFKGHKIESVCIISENKKEKEVVLVSDDDKGGTVLFRVRLHATE